MLSHELAHTLLDYGLPPAVRRAVERCYQASVGERGLWRRPDGAPAYAATSVDEYFAELSMWVWGTHGEYVDEQRKLPTAGPRGLSRYDPDGFELIGA